MNNSEEKKYQRMINSIGFNNFRKFENFQNMPLGKINIFVGGNNAGKSTVVKSILTIFHNLSYYSNSGNSFDLLGKRRKQFYFDVPNTHIGTFKRALYNKAKEQRISFQFEIGDLMFSMEIENPETDLSEELSGTYRNYSVTYNYKKGGSRYPITLESDGISLLDNTGDNFIRLKFPLSLLHSGENEDIQNIRRQITDLSLKLDEAISPDDYISINQKLDNLISTYRALTDDEDAVLETILADEKTDGNDKSDETKIIEIHNLGFEGYVGKNVFCTLALNFKGAYLSSYNDAKTNIEGEDELQSLEEEYNYVQALLPLIKDMEALVSDTFFGYGIVSYIPAHTASQEPIFNPKTDEYQYEVIHNYYKSRFPKDSVIKWMTEFNIGKDFIITPIKGGAYTFQVITMDGETVELADLGMGAIQLMMLLLKLETISSNIGYKIVLVEEPEQNLHPDFQVKLADIFNEYYEQQNIQFIIETHSEYLVRHIQVLVAEGNKRAHLYINPFMIYFFPGEQRLPYDVGFQSNGKFILPFEDGFDNVADEEAMKLYDIEEQSNDK